MSLIAWYPLNGNTNDYSGNNLNGTASNITYSNGKIGQAATYNTSQITILNNDLFKAINEVSLSAWINVPQYTQTEYPTIVAKGTTFGGSQSYSLAITNQGILYFEYLNQDGLRRSTQLSMTTYPINTWIHITGTLNRGVSKLYINGELLVSNSFPNTDTILWVSDNVFIGQNGGSRTFLGKINDVRIYNHALSEKEIKEIAKAKILHYTFDNFQEPTTNLAYNSNKTMVVNGSNITGGSDSFGTYFIKNDNTLWYGGILLQTTNLTALSYYTLSFDIYSDVSFNLNWDANDYADNYTGNDAARELTLSSSSNYLAPNTWQRVYITNKMKADAINPKAGDSFCPRDVNIFGHKIYYKNVQVEMKDHMTPFVVGSRDGIINDQSGFRNNAILTEATTPQWVTDSKIGSGAYKFDGLSTFIEVTDSTKLVFNSTSNFTYTAWVKTSSSALYNMVINIDGDTTGNPQLRVSNGRPQFRGYGLNSISGSFEINDNQWHLLAGGIKNGNYFLYVDSISSGELAPSGALNFTGPLRVGKYNNPGDSISRYFDGIIEDVRIYATALSDTDILELYQTRASVDNGGNLFLTELNENTLNRCPPFEKWILGSGASLNNGILSMPLGSTAQSPYMYIGLNSDWSFRADYFATEQSNYLSFQPNAGYLMGSSYYDAGLNSTKNTENYTGNGNAASYPINTWTTKTWSYLGGNLVQYIRVNISADSTYGQPSGFKIKNPMMTNNVYTGKYINYSDRLIDKTESIQLKLFGTGVYEMNEASEVGVTDGLIAYYPFDKDARDYSGNGYHGTVSGAVLNGGIKGGAYNFDGVDDYINTNIDFSWSISESFTISVWGKLIDETNRVQSLISKIGYEYMFSVYNGSIRFIYWDDAGTNRISLTTSTPTNLADWHLYSVTYANNTANLYLDGILKVTQTGVSGTFKNHSETTKIGYGYLWAGGTNSYLKGVLDEVRVYNRALSAEEVSILYETTAPTTAAMKITKDTVYLKGEFKEVI